MSRYEPSDNIHSDRPRVVAADDQPEVLDAIQLLLESRFDVVATALNGRDAVDIARQLQPDLLVLDVVMPNADGFTAADEVRALGLRAGVVLVSGLADDDYVLRAIDGAAKAFVNKARMGVDLVPALEHALEGRTYIPSASVLPRWRHRDRRNHSMRVCQSDDALLDTYARFAVAALRAGDAVILGHRAPSRLSAIERHLNANGFDAEALARDGRYIVFDLYDAASAAMKNGTLDAAGLGQFFEPHIVRACPEGAGGRRRVAIAGEIAPILCETGHADEAIELERLATDFFDARVTAVLCLYPASCFGSNGSERLKAICSAHPAIVAS